MDQKIRHGLKMMMTNQMLDWIRRVAVILGSEVVTVKMEKRMEKNGWSRM